MATRAWPFTTQKSWGHPAGDQKSWGHPPLLPGLLRPPPLMLPCRADAPHSLGNTAALRGSRAMEQGKLPIKRRSSFSLLKQLQHQMSCFWRQLPPWSSASPRPVHSIGWKEGGGSSILAARPVLPPTQDTVVLLQRAQAQIMNSRNCSSLFS